MTQPPLHLADIEIALGKTVLLSVSESIEPGKTLTLMGPSGSGKSSLLAFIGGYLAPAFDATGWVLLGDRDLTALPANQRRVGLLFQDPLLFPHMSVGENLLFALDQQVRKDERRPMAEQGLAEISLDGFFDRDPATLSGGQKARVALLRVLLSNPNALLLDEPFSKLDAALRNQMRDLVFSQAAKRSLPTLLVTHDPEDARAAGGQLITLG